jgi:hypothetical protein
MLCRESNNVINDLRVAEIILQLLAVQDGFSKRIQYPRPWRIEDGTFLRFASDLFWSIPFAFHLVSPLLLLMSRRRDNGRYREVDAKLSSARQWDALILPLKAVVEIRLALRFRIVYHATAFDRQIQPFPRFGSRWATSIRSTASASNTIPGLQKVLLRN